MAQVNQFGSAPPTGSYGEGCLRFEAMLVDSMDGALSPEDQAAFDQHLQTCRSCSDMLSSAMRGSAWLGLLRPTPPEPPSDLVARILQQTSVQSALDAATARAEQQAATRAASLLGEPRLPLALADPATPAQGRVLAFPARFAARLRPALDSVLQTRFAMTAAMAFFSVALTLNLTGVHLSQMHARDLRPSNLRRNFYEANAHVVRYYESFRVVYELESRVRDLQRNSAPDAPRHDTDSGTPADTDPSSPDGSRPAAQPAAPSGDHPSSNTPNRPAPSTGGRSSGRSSPGSDRNLATPSLGAAAEPQPALDASISPLPPSPWIDQKGGQA